MSVQPKENRSSKLLTAEENSMVFSQLGNKCISQCTVVIELFTSDLPHFCDWSRFGMGVLCFVKDSVKRSYFMRLYCIKRSQLIWEHEIYDELKFLKPRPYLIVFEGQASIICLNFVSEAETLKFAMLLQRYLENRQKKVNSQQSVRRPTPNMYLDQSVMKEIPDVVVGQKEKVRPRRGIKKTDIGVPSNFVHLESGSLDKRLKHLLEGSTENEGRDKKLSKFLDEAGVTPRMLNNRKTREAVRSFIEENQVLEKIQKDPMTYRRPAPQKPPVQQKLHTKPNTSCPPPPPPPPVPTDFTETSNLQFSQNRDNELDTHHQSNNVNLLSEIQKGIKLNRVETQTQKTTLSDGRCDLLQDIQRGIQLKSVTARRENSPIPRDETNNLSSALKKALTVILVANHNSSEEEDDDSFDKWDE